MAGYVPLKITGNSTGLVQNREEFILPDDAYPVLNNAYVWRERILRKKGYELLGRLQRSISQVAGNTNGAGNFLGNLIAIFGLGSTASITPGFFNASVGADLYTETVPPSGLLLKNGVDAPVGTFINYATGDLGLVTGIPNSPVLINMDYYPGLPVMGIRPRELDNAQLDQTLFFDQKYCYFFNSASGFFQEFIPGTTWNAHGALVSGTDFFWSTNYWSSDLTNFSTNNVKLFWETNNTGQFGANADPIRITDGTTWIDFQPPTYGQIDATNFLVNCLAFLPFRNRMIAFNTWEGADNATAIQYSNRVRWSILGNPFIPYANNVPSPDGPVDKGSWRSDRQGYGGFIDIPTNEDIVCIGYVRDNLVIYCEHSTWQLRYTGRSIQPFQVERVNSELGAEGTFSAIQFDTSLVGIGDKGVVECDSYQSERIDIKIPDFVFSFQTRLNSGIRVQGIRDFVNKLAYWTVPLVDGGQTAATSIFPTVRLVYNYENDSWALFSDSLTTLGIYQPETSRTWLNTNTPWNRCNFAWVDLFEDSPSIVGGNQQGYVEYLDELTNNDVSLYISNIVGHAVLVDTELSGTPTVVFSPTHNLKTDAVIQISGIPNGTPYANLNAGINPSTNLPYNAYNGIYSIVVLDANSFELYVYNTTSLQFSTPQLNLASSGTYVGLGQIAIRENFNVKSKKFNFLDEGQNIQLGYIDILMSSTESSQPGAISLNVYLDYDDSRASNTVPQNDKNDGSVNPTPDTFFNAVIPTTQSTISNVSGTKFWQRVYCATRASFLTLEYTFSNAQLAGVEQECNVQIDAQILHIRKAGRMTQG